MSAYALTDFLESYRHAAPSPLREAVADTVLALAQAAVAVAGEIASGALSEAFAAEAGGHNAGGDRQAGLDLYADEHFMAAAGRAPVAVYASEEREHPVLLNGNAPVVLAIDPLDGSSNIDVNVSIGTIFSILPVAEKPARDLMSSTLQPGSAQLAAGFFIYGPQLALALTVGEGTHVFTYSPRFGTFVHTHQNVDIPQRTSEFSINASNRRHWDDAIRHYVDDCLKGSEGPQGRDFNMRWIASLVAEAFRILMRGGVFLYPGDSRKGYSNGRLRLVYEANPIAMLIEQAGGLATDTKNPILTMMPADLHQKVPLVFGSRAEVRQIAHYHIDLDPEGVRSPLFGSRGLFRN